MALADATTPAGAVETEHGEVVAVIVHQNMLLEKMSKEMVLLALEVDTGRNATELRQDHALFDRMLRGLRDGDPELNLPRASDQNLLTGLSTVENLWPLFGDVVSQAAQRRRAARSAIDTLGEVYDPLLRALDRTAKNSGDKARALRSVLAVALDLVDQQRTLSQRLSKEYFLIAYGHEVRKNRRGLKRTYEHFGRTLEALITGDPAQKVVSPPTPQIAAHLRGVRETWVGLLPYLTAAAQGEKPSSEAVAKVAQENLMLLNGLSQAVSLYRAL